MEVWTIALQKHKNIKRLKMFAVNKTVFVRIALIIGLAVVKSKSDYDCDHFGLFHLTIAKSDTILGDVFRLIVVVNFGAG